MFRKFERADNEVEEKYNELKVINFSAKKLIKLFKSSIFSKCLRIAADETRRSGYETGFSVKITGNQKWYIEEVIKGRTDSIRFEFDCEVIANINSLPDMPELEYGELLSLHFHPDEEGAIIPSRNDLNNLEVSFPFPASTPASMAICQVRKNKTVDILFIKGNGVVFNSDVKEYKNVMHDYMTQDEVLVSLSQQGYQAVMLSFARNRKDYELNYYSDEALVSQGPLKVIISK